MKIPARFREGVGRYAQSDWPDLVEFQRSVFGPDSGQTDAGRFRWLFEEHPLRPAEGPEFWVARRAGELVGQQGGIPFVLEAGPHVETASWAIDLMVDPRWRLRGVGPALTGEQVESHRFVFGVNISDAARRAYLRAGWNDIGLVPIYIRPIDARRAVRVSPVAGWWSRAAANAGPFLTAASVVFDRAARMSRVELAKVDRFDERVDALWEATRPAYLVAARRDLAFIQWRFDLAPDADRHARYYLQRDGRTLGYVVLRRDHWRGEPMMLVVDYLAEPRWLAALFARVTALARSEGAIALMCKTLNHRADRVFRLMGFLRLWSGSGGPIRMMAHLRDPQDRTAHLLLEPSNWFLTAGDSDLGQPDLRG